jgi:hypothetical protein
VITPTDFAPDAPQLPSCCAHTLKGVEVENDSQTDKETSKKPNVY